VLKKGRAIGRTRLLLAAGVIIPALTGCSDRRIEEASRKARAAIHPGQTISAALDAAERAWGYSHGRFSARCLEAAGEVEVFGARAPVQVGLGYWLHSGTDVRTGLSREQWMAAARGFDASACRRLEIDVAARNTYRFSVAFDDSGKATDIRAAVHSHLARGHERPLVALADPR
jgi:hypothetical protein